VPVDVYIAHEKKKWKKMPFDPLMHRLAELTKGRILQADQLAKTLSDGSDGRPAPAAEVLKPFLTRVTDATKQITVTGDGDKPVKRPLYVDYVV
jgi:hypothetical protein